MARKPLMHNYIYFEPSKLGLSAALWGGNLARLKYLQDTPYSKNPCSSMNSRDGLTLTESCYERTSYPTNR